METAYHIVYCLEQQYNSAADALAKFPVGGQLLPRLPRNFMEGEDCDTPRISVAKSIEDCMTGIKLLGVFRRCLGANEDAFSYSLHGREVYPILILQLSADALHKPTPEQVPDVNNTNENWITSPATIESAEIRWLDANSIIWEELDGHPDYRAKSVKFTDKKLADADHPWLNGRGHELNSSEPEEFDERDYNAWEKSHE